MSELSKKYGISETTVKALVRDGWLSCSVPQYEEIYYKYKEAVRKNGGFKMSAVSEVASNTNLSESWVYTIIGKFE